MAAFDWPAFLARWNADLPGDDLVASGGVGPPGATEPQLAARLGAAVPPSYRAFLRTSNGWRAPGRRLDGVWLWPAEDVDWLAARRPDWLAASAVASPRSRRDDSLRRTAAEIGATLVIGSADRVLDGLLLHPGVLTPEGDWEAWRVTKGSAARRFASFQAMLDAESALHRELLRLERWARGDPLPPAREAGMDEATEALLRDDLGRGWDGRHPGACCSPSTPPCRRARCRSLPFAPPPGSWSKAGGGGWARRRSGSPRA